MPDVPIVGTATVGAPGVTRKPILLITGQRLFHLSYRCNLWRRQRDFNLQPPPYRGDALALSYAGSSSVVQILPPLHFVNSRLPHECARGKDRHSAGLTKQFHSSLYWRSISLSRIARTARSNKVLPVAQPTPSAWNYVLELEFAAQQLRTAVLARVSIADEDVLPRQSLDPHGQPPILTKTNDARQLHTDVHIAVVCFFNHCHSLDEHHDCPASAGNIHGLIARVEH